VNYLKIRETGGGWPHKSMPTIPPPPKCQERLGDLIGNAIKVARLATSPDDASRNARSSHQGFSVPATESPVGGGRGNG
jgi:hypothetical protein